MNITNAKYVDSNQSGDNDSIDATIDGVLMHVPISTRQPPLPSYS